nr:hypothetical protein CFP56_68758 [Quercus suber]
MTSGLKSELSAKTYSIPVRIIEQPKRQFLANEPGALTAVVMHHVLDDQCASISALSFQPPQHSHAPTGRHCDAWCSNAHDCWTNPARQLASFTLSLDGPCNNYHTKKTAVHSHRGVIFYTLPYQYKSKDASAKRPRAVKLTFPAGGGAAPGQNLPGFP